MHKSVHTTIVDAECKSGAQSSSEQAMPTGRLKAKFRLVRISHGSATMENFATNLFKGFRRCGGLSDRTTGIRQFFSKFHDRRRRGRIWRLDRARTAEKGRESHVAGCVGPRK